MLEKGKPPLLTRVDYISTVSGGGYFGSFLGALFRRDWINSADDVAAVLRDEMGPPGGQSPARFLRDNGRYLAPRGSGDLPAVILRKAEVRTMRLPLGQAP